MEDKAIRVLIADDRPEVRSALRVLLVQEQGIIVVGEAGDAKQAVKLVRERQPDLALLDWELPDQSGASTLAKLRAVRPDLIVVALSGLPEARQAALDAGADIFVSKGDPPERLIEAVNEHRYAGKISQGVEK